MYDLGWRGLHSAEIRQRFGSELTCITGVFDVAGHANHFGKTFRDLVDTPLQAQTAAGDCHLDRRPPHAKVVRIECWGYYRLAWVPAREQVVVVDYLIQCHCNVRPSRFPEFVQLAGVLVGVNALAERLHTVAMGQLLTRAEHLRPLFHSISVRTLVVADGYSFRRQDVAVIPSRGQFCETVFGHPDAGVVGRSGGAEAALGSESLFRLAGLGEVLPLIV